MIFCLLLTVGCAVRQQETTAPEEELVTTPGAMKFPSVALAAVIGISFLAVLWIGVYPAPLLEAVEAASRAILPGG